MTVTEQFLSKTLVIINAYHGSNRMFIHFSDGTTMQRVGLTHKDIVRIHKEGVKCASEMIVKYGEPQEIKKRFMRLPFMIGREC